MQIDPSRLSRRDGYRLMISSIVPRAIAFVSTSDRSGRTNAAPFSYFTGVGTSPPSLLICAGKRRNGFKDTQRNIVETREFVVNAVVEEIMDAVVISGLDHEAGVSEIDLAGMRTAPAVKVRAPLIADSPLNMECRLMNVFEVAGCAIIVGEVVWVHARDDLILDVDGGAPVIDIARLKPIARLGGDQYARLGEVFRKGKP